MNQFLADYFAPLAGILFGLMVVGLSATAVKKDSLFWRFWSIIFVGVLAGLIAYEVPPGLGIDLAGGTSLLYELDLSKIKENSQQSTTELAERVIDVLKKRVDPNGVKNMIWRVVGGKRIQIQMPLADARTREAQAEEKLARSALQKSTLKQSEWMSAITKQGPAREAAITALAPLGTDQYAVLNRLADANDKLEAAKAAIEKFPVGQAPSALMEEKYRSQTAFDAARNEVEQSNVDLVKLTEILTASENPKNLDAHKLLEEFPGKYPRQKQLINDYIAAHRKVIAMGGGGVDDPAELRRLVTSAGVLDFRITVEPDELGKAGSDAYEAAVQSLNQNGPDHPLVAGGSKARWFQIDPNGVDNFNRGGFIVANWAGQPYVLCYDDTYHSLTHSDPVRKPWRAFANDPQVNPTDGGLALPFRLDSIGAIYMGELTGNNIHHPMAILLDDKAMTAPNINSEIRDSGEITFGAPDASHPIEAKKKEAEQLKQIMDAGSLPATLQREPISAENISASMGADNITSGLHSALYSLVAVIIFMMLYYTITGIFADLAMLLNLLMVVAAMAYFHGTFTLPGIAGLVLTLGMAVDANVLINERIREEIHKGASLWMAIKQGYDKVFWTIFDANLTTSLTSIVLIYFGSEEVKGFGVTLLIGLIIHMFTALFVTRTLMMAFVRWGWLRAIDDHSLSEYIKEIFTLTWLRRGHWPFMRVITVTNIDWISKRHIFWGISAVITVGGLVAFIARGEDKYDIEFRGGTQVTFELKPDAAGHFLSIDEVRHRIESLSSLPGLKDLQSTTVYKVGDENQHRFEMQTTVKNPPDNPDYVKTVLLDPLAKEFHDVLDVTEKVNFNRQDVDEKQMQSLMDAGFVRPITGGTLDQVFARTPITGMPTRDVVNYNKGVAILLDNMWPPQTVAKLTDRIQRAQVAGKSAYREFAVIPITAATNAAAAGTQAGSSPAASTSSAITTEPATTDDVRPLTRAVLVSLDPSFPFDENNEALWQNQVAVPEWAVVRRAMSPDATDTQFKGVTTFDAGVAGQARQQALLAIVLSLVLIVAYVWIRFGGIWYGIGAICSLVHDAIVALAATVLSGLAYHYFFNDHANWLLISDFKINLTTIAAYLTVIGYSVNDTIVIFDRVRELRGRSTAPLSAKLINDAINQCFGRTIWTTFTVFIVVLIMYIWGGEGVRGFSFAMLFGVFTGAYSTLAIASPMLLTTARLADRSGPGGSARRINPFLQKTVPELDSAPAPALPQTDFPPNAAPGNA